MQNELKVFYCLGGLILLLSRSRDELGWPKIEIPMSVLIIINFSLAIAIYLDSTKCFSETETCCIPSDIGLMSILENDTNFDHPTWNKDLFEIKDEVIAQSI